MSLKDQLLLTSDEAFAMVQKVAIQKNKSAKKPTKGRKRGRKWKAQEVEGDVDNNSSHVGSDLVLPSEIFDCVVVSQQ